VKPRTPEHIVIVNFADWRHSFPSTVPWRQCSPVRGQRIHINTVGWVFSQVTYLPKWARINYFLNFCIPPTYG